MSVHGYIELKGRRLIGYSSNLKEKRSYLLGTALGPAVQRSEPASLLDLRGCRLLRFQMLFGRFVRWTALHQQGTSFGRGQSASQRDTDSLWI